MASTVASTVVNALTLCGVLVDTSNFVWNSMNALERISGEVFNNNFNTCVDITFMEDSWKTYSLLMIAEGNIRNRAGTKVNIKTFMQWTCDQIRTSVDPASTPFPIVNRDTMMDRYYNHKQWMDDAYSMSKTAILKNFAKKMKWIIWKSTLVNFLKSQLGRNGVPVSYIVRDNVAPVQRQNTSVLDDCTYRTPLTRQAFDTDAVKVHAFIVRLISESLVAEQKILPHNDALNERIYFNALKAFYEGVCANAKAVLSAKSYLQEMFYVNKKHLLVMWWDHFEVRSINNFTIVDKAARHVVHTDKMKLWMLNRKIKADFLTTMKTNVEM